jgi:gamma-glutamyltranspeptidase / glutathione hydrolase
MAWAGLGRLCGYVNLRGMTRQNATYLGFSVLGLVACFALLWWAQVASPVAYAASSPPLTTARGVVASDQALASEVGAAILARGGNAADAAAATALALGVVNPASSGIGGGGFAVVYVAKEKKTYVLDFRETAPAALSPDRFVRDGELDVMLSRRGGLAAGVPGEIAGLELLVRRFGNRPWRSVVAPAERLAREGFFASWFFAHAAGVVAPQLSPGPLRDLLAPGGKVVERGQLVRRPALARTLARIGSQGRDGFYRGPVARDMIAAITAAGGVMTLEDLAGYRVVERDPLEGRWGSFRVVTMPLPSSGGIVLLEALGLLEASGFDLAAAGAGSSAALHMIAEVLAHGFADRARFLGEASPEEMVGSLLDPDRLRRLAATISPRRAAAHGRYGEAGLEAWGTGEGDGGTSHLCVIDRDGNAVALTTTVNGYYGARLVAPKSGVVLNNEIDDFALAAGVPNMFGLVQSEYNLVGPGKRPLSSMTPTLVLDGDRVVGCLGGSGGPRIISNVFQALLNVFAFGMDANAAVSAPRLHHQWTPDQVFIEPEIPADVRRGLERRGHNLQEGARISTVQLIVVRADGTREAASDPRKDGAPAAE